MKQKTSFSLLAELYLLFFKIGAVTFGGGLAMLPILESELSEKRDWVTKETLLDYFAIGQVTPGIIAVNVATFIGYTRAGLLGGCLATLGVVSPSLIIITVIAKCLQGFADIVWVQKALLGINVAVAALLCKIVVTFAKKLGSWWKWLLFLASFAAIAVLGAPTILVVCCSLVLGALVYAVELMKSRAPAAGEPAAHQAAAGEPAAPQPAEAPDQEDRP